MTETIDVQQTPSPAPVTETPSTFEVPKDRAAYDQWRQTGKLPEQPKAESAPASAEGDRPTEKPAPGSEPGKKPQERRDNAATRLNELLADLKRAGLTPAELKTFKREMQAQPQAEPVKTPAPEQTAKPAKKEPPQKPVSTDPKFKTWDEYEAARDQYAEDMAKFRAEEAVENYRQEQAQNQAQLTVKQKMAEAHTRYGDEGIQHIQDAAKAITSDQAIPPAVRAILDQSPVWTDVLYTLGQGGELQSFIDLAKADPGQAIRKAVLLEHLVTQELAKGAKAAPAADDETPVRDASGKFQPKKNTPEKRESEAPPPPREMSGRGTTPADEVEAALKSGDFAAYRRAQNARDLAARQGR